jgi:DNA invertase Pin-like site-specific DNA recombinase
MRNEKWHPSRGSTNGQAKLTEDDVREIRRLYATGNFTQRELALEFGIARSAIGKIVRRQAWKHVV